MYRLAGPVFVYAALSAAFSSSATAQAQALSVRPRITQAIDESKLTTLRGNTHPLARAEFDQGIAPADLPMEQMLLVLSRSAEQETALESLLAQQQDKSSAQYHKWLTPQQFGEQFGATDQDIQAVTSWLQVQGFAVDRISNGKTVIEFSGTSTQVRNGFHTDIHKYVVNGMEHWANASDPQIPSALTPVVAGVVTMHNFTKKSQLINSNRQIPFTYMPGSRPQYTISSGSYALAPADYATIYDINPLYQAGINGAGTTIAVVARSNILVSDIASFRSYFGLSNNPPVVVITNSDPGRQSGSGDEAEAVLDATWAGAIAPSATVDLVVSSSTNSTDGVDLSELYIIDNNLGDVMTESYGDCEANYTQAQANYYASLAQQAAAEGITYAVAAGDSGAEGCDDPDSEVSATGPVSVNVLASNAYVVAVGGTQFNEGGLYSEYWASNNGSTGGSALSYIPEDVWNESCTVAQCGNSNAGIWAGGGGASTLFPKPSWQTGVASIPNDGARDVPDVSLTAASHDFYLLCLDDSCSATRRRGASFSGVSGTSAPTPSFAGIMALVVQKVGSRQGNADPELYALAAQDGTGSCDGSSLYSRPPAHCTFNDVTVGNNAVPGESGYGSSGAQYQATYGYDLVTGLGSMNVANLVNRWGGTSIPASEFGFHMSIDQPGPPNSTFIGLATFAGWALNDQVGIGGVQIAIDGAPYGAATYGLSRPDVCALHEGSIGCPNVGWSIIVDTTQLADGTHQVDVTATSNSGLHSTVSGSFTVANWSSTDSMTVHIDIPGSNGQAFGGLVNFGGWAIDSTGFVDSVFISVDGIAQGSATYGGARPDVCAAFPGRARCPNVGWTFGLDTTGLTDGTHTVAVTGFTATGQNTTVTNTFSVSNSSGSPIAMVIDQPNSGSAPFSGAATFGGWALDNTNGVGISSLAVSVDGASYGNATYGGARPDVCAVFPGRTGCPNVGWSFIIDTTTIANGNHTLQVTVTPTAGQRLTISSSFTVANTTMGTPLKMNIDQPNAQNATVIGLTQFAGWAIDDNGAISNVAISVDGASKGNVTYGVSRPDVCSAFPGRAGCPNVGWTFPLDTTLIPDGPHTVAASGTSANGDHLTLTSTFTVANWTSANPMRISIDIPNSQSAALSGIVNLAGWATSDIAAIATVAVSVDGVSFGNAAYGVERPDVCAAYPGRAGCPNVGWNFNLDSRLLANGKHTLEVTATSDGNQHSTVTATFQVSNSGPITTAIDQPNAQSGTFRGSATFGGWALDTTNGVGVAAVKIFVDGSFVGDANYGVSRSDVCALPAFANAVGCPNVGWTFSLDTTLLPNGSHTLQVQPISSTGQEETLSSSFILGN